MDSLRLINCITNVLENIKSLKKFGFLNLVTAFCTFLTDLIHICVRHTFKYIPNTNLSILRLRLIIMFINTTDLYFSASKIACDEKLLTL